MRVQRRFRHRGQSLLIFALTAMVLFAIIGLAVDAGVGYFNSTLLERTSAASSLAGVTYMPDGWSSGTADSQVQAIAIKNGMKNGIGGVSVITCEVDGKSIPFAPCGNSSASFPAQNQLAVKVCEPVANSFIRLIGFPASHPECRVSVAEYLRPITLGQPGNQLGGDLLTDPSGLGGFKYKYFVRTEGYNSNRSEGDAFTPRLDDHAGVLGTCRNYASDASSNCYSQFNTANPDIHFLSGPGHNNTDLAVAPLPDAGGYNYQIFVPAGQVGGDIQVFNPIFAPDSAAGGPGSDPCTGAQASAVAGVNHNYNFHECDSLGGHVTAGNPSSKNQYSTMAYTVYKVTNVFDHRSDTLMNQMLVDPIDAVNWNSPSWIEVRNNTVHNGGLPDLFHQWQSVCNYVPQAAPSGTETGSLVQQGPGCSSLDGGAKGAYYRLRIDTLDYLGKDPTNGGDPNSTAHKGLSVRVYGCATCTVGGLNDMAIFTPLVSAGGAQTSFPISLMAVPPEYRGQTISVDIYDPGDISCPASGSCAGISNVLTILDEKNNPATLGKSPLSGLGVAWMGPSRSLPEKAITAEDCAVGGTTAVIETQCDPAVSGNHDIPQNASSRNLYNGTWIRYWIAVDPSYNPGCPSVAPCLASADPANWYWSLRYSLTQGAGTDTITFGVSYNGSPVHLVTG